MRHIFLHILSLLLSGLCVQAQDTPLTIISNNNGAPDQLQAGALKSILRGEKQRWPNGTKVVIALMKTNTPVGSSTVKKIYNMSADELNKYWLALVFQGKAAAPTFFNSTSELEAFVAQTPGAIGVTGSTGNMVRSITVEGKKSL